MTTTSPSLWGHYVRGRERLPLRTRVLFTLAAVGLIHLLAAACLATGAAPGSRPLALGVVLAAYVAGMKHSYDWDHVSAIDNSTRKFVAEGRNPASVGFAFSLGHSLVVTVAGAMVVGGVQFVHGAFQEGSGANHVLGLVGMGVSGGYLLVLGLYNGATAVGLLRRLGSGRAAAARGHQHGLEHRWGLVSRLLEKPLARVKRPRDIFVIGFLFGLGFDTATTIGLLVLTASASLAGVPPLALIGLPLAFTAAMTLCDTANGLGMMHLYRTALQDSSRRLRFNAVVTTVSAVSALFIAVITLGGFFHSLLGLTDPLSTWLAEIDLGEAGLGLVALFALVWLGAWWSGARATGSEPRHPGSPGED